MDSKDNLYARIFFIIFMSKFPNVIQDHRIFFQVETIQNMSAAEEDDSMFLKSDLQNNPIIATLVLSE